MRLTSASRNRPSGSKQAASWPLVNQRQGEKPMRKRLIVVAVAAAVAIGSLNIASAKMKSLYSRLGGKTAITAVVNQFVTNCATDTRINKFFADTAKDPKRLAKFKT